MVADNAALSDQIGHGAMRGTGNGVAEGRVDDEIAAPGFKADCGRFKKVGKEDRPELRPQAVGRTKIGYAAIGRDAGAREQHAAARGLDHTDQLVYDLDTLNDTLPGRPWMKYLHTMIRVSDLDKSLDFFVNKLGFVEQRRL